MDIEKLNEMNLYIDRYLYNKNILVTMMDFVKSKENSKKKDLKMELK